MATYDFWDTDCGTGPLDRGNVGIREKVSLEELASYVVTDWDPYPYPKSSIEGIGAAKEAILPILGLIADDTSGRWVMKRSPRMLSRGWKAMMSEGLGIAFSRHSAAKKGYHHCVHLDHFLPGGFFHSPSLEVRKKKKKQNVLRPDYLMAARLFRRHAIPEPNPLRNVCASMEVKGQSASLKRKVPKRQKAQSQNLELFSHGPGDSVDELKLEQKLLSIVRANSSLVSEEPRRVGVRHSNYYYYRLEDAATRPFLPIVFGHYLRIVCAILGEELRGEVTAIFRYMLIGVVDFGDLGDRIMGALETKDPDRNRPDRGVVSVSPHLMHLLEALLRGELLSQIQEDGKLEPLSKHLAELEDAVESDKGGEGFLRADGFRFRFNHYRSIT